MSPRTLRRTLLGAGIASLLLHLATVFSTELYYWLTLPEFEQTKLRETSQKLAAQRLEDGRNNELAQVTRLESLDIYFHHLAPAKAIETKPPRPAPKKVARTPIAVPPIKASVPEQAVAIASKPTPAPNASSVASAVAALPAPITQASAPQASVPKAIAASQPGQQLPALALQRFPSELEITYIYGVIPATMHWKISEGRYNLRLEGGFMGTSRTFLSTGRVDQHGVQPEQFVEYRNGKPEPYFQADFDWQQMTAEIGKLSERKTETFVSGDQDIFSAAFHIGLMGESRPEQTFSIFSGRKKYADAQLRVAGEATLRLGSRDINALLLRGKWDNRQVDFWLAPEWHNIPVRMTIVLGNELTLDIWANEITIDGKKVLEWVKIQNKRPGDSGNR